MYRFLSATLRVLSGEFLLSKRANSGTVVLLRSLIVTVVVYVVMLPVREIADPRSIWGTLSPWSFRAAVYETIPWIGAIFAGAYAALYTRFSSQWTYLAGLYNQILLAESESEASPEDRAVWWAAFIEDALELHLAAKPMFAAFIRHLLKERPEVKEAFRTGVPGGPWRLAELEELVERVYQQSEGEWKKRAQEKGLKAA